MLKAAYKIINFVRQSWQGFTEFYQYLSFNIYLTKTCFTNSDTKITVGLDFRWYHSIIRNQVKKEILPIIWNMQLSVIGFHVICFLHALADVCHINAVWSSGHGQLIHVMGEALPI